jgi:hypothetical protein
VVTLSAPVTAVVAGSFQVWMNFEFVTPDSVDVSDPLHPRFAFNLAMDDAESWKVVDPSSWTFADGQPMVEPFEGEVG